MRVIKRASFTVLELGRLGRHLHVVRVEEDTKNIQNVNGKFCCKKKAIWKINNSLAYKMPLRWILGVTLLRTRNRWNKISTLCKGTL